MALVRQIGRNEGTGGLEILQKPLVASDYSYLKASIGSRREALTAG